LLQGSTEAEQAAARRDLQAALQYVEQGLSALSPNGPYFLGSAPSLVDFTFYPWFERLPALAHVRNFAVPAQHTRLLHWQQALERLDAVVAHQNPIEFYIERYAQLASAAKKVA
jgi:glutathione S-transferase